MIVQFNDQIVSRQNDIMNWISVHSAQGHCGGWKDDGYLDDLICIFCCFSDFTRYLNGWASGQNQMLCFQIQFDASHWWIIQSAVVTLLYCNVHPRTIQMSYPFSPSDAQILVWDDHIIASNWNLDCRPIVTKNKVSKRKCGLLILLWKMAPSALALIGISVVYMICWKYVVFFNDCMH